MHVKANMVCSEKYSDRIFVSSIYYFLMACDLEHYSDLYFRIGAFSWYVTDLSRWLKCNSRVYHIIMCWIISICASKCIQLKQIRPHGARHYWIPYEFYLIWNMRDLENLHAPDPAFLLDGEGLTKSVCIPIKSLGCYNCRAPTGTQEAREQWNTKNGK